MPVEPELPTLINHSIDAEQTHGPYAVPDDGGIDETNGFISHSPASGCAAVAEDGSEGVGLAEASEAHIGKISHSPANGCAAVAEDVSEGVGRAEASEAHIGEIPIERTGVISCFPASGCAAVVEDITESVGTAEASEAHIGDVPDIRNGALVGRAEDSEAHMGEIITEMRLREVGVRQGERPRSYTHVQDRVRHMPRMWTCQPIKSVSAVLEHRQDISEEENTTLSYDIS